MCKYHIWNYSRIPTCHVCMNHPFEIKIPSKCAPLILILGNEDDMIESFASNMVESSWTKVFFLLRHDHALVSNVSRGYCRVASQFPAIFMLFCCHWLKWIGWIGDNSKPKERSRVCRVKKRLVTRLSCLLRTLCTYIESKKILNTDCPLLLCIRFWPC